MSIDFVEGDTGSILRVSCKNLSDGSPLTLVSKTAFLIWKNASGTVIEKSMTIDNPASAGVVSYRFLAGELYPNIMRFEVKIVDSGGLVLRSMQPMKFTVRVKIQS